MINYPASFIKTFLVCFLLASGVVCFAQQAPADAVSIDQLGAQANNPGFDNGPIIVKALQTGKSVVFPANNYFVSTTIHVNDLNGAHLYFRGGPQF
jgi:hypothetical protein